jgi:hypothetical protein
LRNTRAAPRSGTCGNCRSCRKKTSRPSRRRWGDIEIARAANKKPIQEIGAKLGIPSEHLLPYGHDKAKVGQDFINSAGADRPTAS